MRPLILATLLLLTFSIPPVDAAGDECNRTPTAERVCVALDTRSPDPRVPQVKKGIYLVVPISDCTPAPTGGTCRGILYEENNSCGGLQRKQTTDCGAADARLAI